MFIPDTPINLTDDDCLNRVDFSHKLAETIRDWERDESIVIALYGPWGSGKTSLLNLATDHIHSTTKDLEDNPIIVPFNPWNFSEKNQLFLAFFQQLYVVIGNSIPGKKDELKDQFGKLVNTLSGIEVLGDIPVVGKWLKGGIKLAGLFFPDQSLEDQRAEIIKLFRELNRRIIIIIDDIDRLTESEIRQLFQMIKINADFPNSIYLVAFDRIVVEKALNTEQGIKGREYLEKIVQVGFDIPAIETSLVEKQLFEEIFKILKATKIDENIWDSVRWGNMYHGGIQPLFQSMRDVKRFVNGLSFNLQIIGAEVNPVDFIGLEALRIFLPEIYSGVANNKMLFTQSQSLFRGTTDQDLLKAQFDRVFSPVDDDIEKEIGKNICVQLFPSVARFYLPMFGGDYRQRDWRQARRICSEDVFDFYFTLGTPKDEVSRAELDIIAQKANDPDQLLGIFQKLVDEGRFARMLDLISDIRGTLDHNHALGLCQALLIIGDEIPNESRSLLNLDLDFQLALELFYTLHHVDQNERCRWFEEQIQTGRSLFTPVYVVWHDTPQEGKQRESSLFSGDCYERLRRVCVEQIEIRARQRTLKDIKRLSLLMYRWREWTEHPEHIDDFVVFMISTPQNSLDLLVGFLDKANVQSMSDYVGQTEWYINAENLSGFVDLEKLHEITDPITEEAAKEISEQHWIALSAFRRVLNESPPHGV